MLDSNKEPKLTFVPPEFRKLCQEVNFFTDDKLPLVFSTPKRSAAWPVTALYMTNSAVAIRCPEGWLPDDCFPKLRHVEGDFDRWMPCADWPYVQIEDRGVESYHHVVDQRTGRALSAIDPKYALMGKTLSPKSPRTNRSCDPIVWMDGPTPLFIAMPILTGW